MKKIILNSILVLFIFLFTACSQKVNYKASNDSNNYKVSKKYCVKSKIFTDYSKKQVNSFLLKEAREDVLFEFLDENIISQNNSYEEFLSNKEVKIDKKIDYFTDDYKDYCIEFDATVANPVFFFNDVNLEEYSRQNSAI